MQTFVKELKGRNADLFYFGLLCLSLSIAFLGLTQVTTTQVHNVNAWYKPFKFCFSTFTFAWAMGWYCHYLEDFNVKRFNWTIIFLLGFEIVYIAIQGGRGELSHYNISSAFYSIMYSLMGVAAAAATLYTGYVGFRFCRQSFPNLSKHYVWAIRFAILLFVIFAFEGSLMGSRMNHNVGGVNDNSDWFILSWSRTVGDLRVAHFVGMHALQALPLLSFFVFKNTKSTIIMSLLYGLLATTTLVQALQGKPFFSSEYLDTPEKVETVIIEQP
jgi:hypothetical protein